MLPPHLAHISKSSPKVSANPVFMLFKCLDFSWELSNLEKFRIFILMGGNLEFRTFLSAITRCHCTGNPRVNAYFIAGIYE